MVELGGVTFAYRGEAVLHDVSVRFPAGEITAVIGPNGCGKSTLLALAAGLLTPGRGSVAIGGRELRALGRRELARRVALLRQSSPAVPLPAEEVVLAGRYPHRRGWPSYSPADRRIAEEAMELAACTGCRGRRTDRLSGGERQRVLLAAALAQQTPVLLLDEPTTYLDIGTAHGLLRRLRRINETEGKTVVVVVHDLELALRHAHRIVLLQGGRIAGEGAPEEIAGAGCIQRVFGVELKRFTQDGRCYYCFG